MIIIQISQENKSISHYYWLIQQNIHFTPWAAICMSTCFAPSHCCSWNQPQLQLQEQSRGSSSGIYTSVWRSHLQRRISIVVASTNQRRRFTPLAINRRHLSVYFTTSVSSFHFHSVCVYHWHNLHTESRGITSKLLTVWKRIEVQPTLLKVCSHQTFAFTSPSTFNIVSMVTQMQTQRLGLKPFSASMFALILTQC